MAAVTSGHPVQKTIAIYFHPCNPLLLPQNTCSILFCGIFLTNLFVNLVAFGNIMCKFKIAISLISRDTIPLSLSNARNTPIFQPKGDYEQLTSFLNVNAQDNSLVRGRCHAHFLSPPRACHLLEAILNRAPVRSLDNSDSTKGRNIP